MNLSRYGYLVGILIVLGIIASILFSIRTNLFSKDVRTYTDTKYGFTFDYPASFDLIPPFEEPRAVYDENLSTEEQEAAVQRYEDAWTERLEEINHGPLSMGEGRDFRQITVSVINPKELPTIAEENERCKREAALVEDLSIANPEGSFEGPYGCGPDSITQELVRAEQEAIMTLPVGTPIHKTHEVLDDGNIVEINGIRGLRGMTFGYGSSSYRASFVTYTVAGDRIDLDIDLFMDSSEYPETVSPDDVSFREKAESDPRNAVLDGIISTFTFL